MSFKLIIATGYFAASAFPQFTSDTMMAASIQSGDKFPTEQACVEAAIEANKTFKIDADAADKAIQRVRDVPFAAVMARRGSPKNNMDRLTQKDWDEINAERRKATEAMPPVPLKRAFCIDADLWGRN